MSSYQGSSKDSLKAYALMKQREKAKEELQKKKDVITKNLQLSNKNNKFVTYTETLEDELRSNIVGLVTLDEMRKRHEQIIKDKEIKIITETLKLDSSEDAFTQNNEKHTNKRSFFMEKSKNVPPFKKQMLSFNMDDDDDDDETKNIQHLNIEKNESDKNKGCKRKVSKNPEADISYLPDKDRAQKERLERERLVNEWIELNTKIKDERIVISYMYWDGSGHRKSCYIKKGSTIEQLLQKCLADLQDEFLDLKSVSVEKLMFIKQDLIIPHHYTIYDFIVSKYTNDDGIQIFNFDNPINKNNPDLPQIEKADSLPGKVCLRSWYNRNKHIYPASLWKPFDPDKCDKQINK